jgi:hypothetical protein
MASPPHKERIVDQLKSTAIHNFWLYVSRPRQTFVTKLGSGVLYQNVGNDLDLLLFLHVRRASKLGSSLLLYGPEKETPSHTLRCSLGVPN